MAFAIKAEIRDPRAKTFSFTAHKTMYGGKQIAEGDTIFLFASENAGGQGLVARGVVTAAAAVAKKRGLARQTPRVNIAVKRTAGETPAGAARAQAFHRLGRWPAGDGAEFQVLSAGDGQDRRHFGGDGGVPRRIFLGGGTAPSARPGMTPKILGAGY